MKKLLCGICCWLAVMTPAWSSGLTLDELPDQLYLTQHWVSYTTSFDIESKSRKLGTLYRRVLSFPLRYDLYDYSNNLIASASARFFSFSAHFDIYDMNNMPMNSVEEKIFTFFPSFVLNSNSGEKLARAEMNFWGTTFTVYDVETDKVLAVMWRSFFRLKNDWIIDIKDKELLRSRHINPGMLLTVLAFQADSEYWEQQNRDDRTYTKKPMALASTTKSNVANTTTQPQKSLRAKVDAAMSAQSLKQIPLMDQTDLEVLAQRIQNDYQDQQPDIGQMTDEEKKDGFVDYCLQLVNSDQLTPEEKRGVLYLLEQRLGAEAQK